MTTNGHNNNASAAKTAQIYRKAADCVMFRHRIYTRDVWYAQGQLFCLFRNFWYELREEKGLFRMTGTFFSKREFADNY